MPELIPEVIQVTYDEDDFLTGLTLLSTDDWVTTGKEKAIAIFKQVYKRLAINTV